MFAKSANLWTYIGDLPAPRFDAAVAVVSSTEILVAGVGKQHRREWILSTKEY